MIIQANEKGVFSKINSITVKDLKEAIKELDDSMEVVVDYESSNDVTGQCYFSLCAASIEVFEDGEKILNLITDHTY